MLIYVKIEKRKKKGFSSDRRTDTRSTQNYSSEPHNSDGSRSIDRIITTLYIFKYRNILNLKQITIKLSNK